ncbi:MAG: (d)CMP kinase [Chloroflexi bacterium]|nr:MAG: (d)CMP kinase [Chloroflexota bacterium]
MARRGPVITIDGPVGAGKSAVSQRVAERLGLPFVDSGLLYRAVAWLALERGVALTDPAALAALAELPRLQIVGDRVLDGDRDLTTFVHQPEINWNLSAVSSQPEVREAINRKLRQLAGGGVVMAGRDIGTVVFPDADWKFFLTASLEERVRRRAAQFQRRGEPADQASMTQEVGDRDRADSERSVAPLKPAPDAVVIDTDGVPLDEVVDQIVATVRRSSR